MNASILFAVLPFLVFIAFVWGILSITNALVRNQLKPLIEAFGCTDTMQNGKTVPRFSIGSMRLKNIVKMSEDSNAIFLKTWLTPPLRIPFSAFSEITELKDVFKNPILLKFSKKELPPIRIILSGSQKDNFPVLMSKIVKNTTDKEIKMETSVPESLNTVQLKQKLGDALRITAILFALILFGFYLASKI